MRGRQGGRHTQSLDVFEETREYSKLKVEALDRTVWRTRCGRGCGHVITQTAERMNYN